MKVNTETEFTNLISGKSIMADDRPMTMRLVLINALLTPTEQDKGISGKEKLERHQIAEKISKANGSVELNVSEVKKCLDLVDHLYGPSIVGPVHNLLDPKEK